MEGGTSTKRIGVEVARNDGRSCLQPIEDEPGLNAAALSRAEHLQMNIGNGEYTS